LTRFSLNTRTNQQFTRLQAPRLDPETFGVPADAILELMKWPSVESLGSEDRNLSMAKNPAARIFVPAAAVSHYRRASMNNGPMCGFCNLSTDQIDVGQSRPKANVDFGTI